MQLSIKIFLRLIRYIVESWEPFKTIRMYMFQYKYISFTVLLETVYIHFFYKKKHPPFSSLQGKYSSHLTSDSVLFNHVGNPSKTCNNHVCLISMIVVLKLIITTRAVPILNILFFIIPKLSTIETRDNRWIQVNRYLYFCHLSVVNWKWTTVWQIWKYRIPEHSTRSVIRLLSIKKWKLVRTKQRSMLRHIVSPLKH